MQRQLPEISKGVHQDVVPLVSYALSEHPKGLDPIATDYEMDSTGFSYETVIYIWDEFYIKFHWDRHGMGIGGHYSDDTFITTERQPDYWEWPMDPMDRVEAAVLLDAIFESVLGSPA